MKKLLIVSIILAAFGLITWKMLKLAKTECALCIEFNGRKLCDSALGPSEDEARKEAQNTLCALLASGVTEVVACQRAPQSEVNCHPAP